MLKKIAMMGLCAVSAFALHMGELNINDLDLEIGAKLDVGQFNHDVEPNTLFIGARFLKVDAEHSEYDNADINPYFELNMMMMKEVQSSGFKIGLGTKVNYTEVYNNQFLTIPLGIEGSYKIPVEDAIPMYLTFSVYYSPKVLSFLDADYYFGSRISYDIEVIQNGIITIGFRNMETNFDVKDGSFVYNKSFFGGYRLLF